MKRRTEARLRAPSDLADEADNYRDLWRSNGEPARGVTEEEIAAAGKAVAQCVEAYRKAERRGWETT